VSDNSPSRHDESALRSAQVAAFDCSTMVCNLWVLTAGPHIVATDTTALRANLTPELDKLDRAVARFDAEYPKVEECLVRAVTRQRTGLVEIFGRKWAIAHEAAAETARKFQHARHLLDKPKALYALAWDIVDGEAGRAIAAEFEALDEHIRQEYLWGIAGDDKPTDLIAMTVALQNFKVDRSTLLRAIKNGLRSYRLSGAPSNSPHQFSEADLLRRYPQR
jgi:hypothetical protein